MKSTFSNRTSVKIAAAFSALSLLGIATQSSAEASGAKFTLHVSSGQVTMSRTETVVVDITIGRNKGFGLPVYLGVSGVPTALRVSLSPNPVKGKSTAAKLTISATPKIEAKTYTLSVAGSSKGQTSRATVKVTITGTPGETTTATNTTTPTRSSVARPGTSTTGGATTIFTPSTSSSTTVAATTTTATTTTTLFTPITSVR